MIITVFICSLEISYLRFDDFLKDLEKLLLAYIPISISVDNSDKLLDFFKRYFFDTFHILKSISDEIKDFTCIQGTTFIDIVGLEYFLDCEAQIFIITHIAY